MVIKKISKYRLMRMKKIALRDGHEIIDDEILAFCYICGKKDKPENFTIDHFLAYCNGGTDKLKNLRICCQKCNTEKAMRETPQKPPPKIYRYFIRPIRKFIRRMLWKRKNGGRKNS